MERFLNAVMNIGESSYFPCNVKLLSRYDHYPSKCCLIFVVQEGTGTRCPLDVTVIHNSSLSKPQCDLSGDELDPLRAGTSLTVEEAFAAINEHGS